MPVVDSYLKAPPSVEATGEHRGTVIVEFTGGRTVERRLRAPDAAAWAELMLDIEERIESETQESDANENIKDEEISANGEATRAQRAVAYLRRSMEQEQAADAYALMARFNNFRTDNGWSWNQVVTNLAAAGLEQEEFDEMRASYQYLNGNGRPAILAEARTIQAQWEAR